MRQSRHHDVESDDIIQVVLDDETAGRLRAAASRHGMEVEQLIVSLLHASSYAVDSVLVLDPS